MKFVLKLINEAMKPAGMEDYISIGMNGKNYRHKLKNWIKYAQKYPIEHLDPNMFSEELKGVREDPKNIKKRIANADLQYPIIIVKHVGGNIIVDGTHRIRKAMRLGVPVKAHVIPFEDLASFKRGKK